jgi:hypothetical protein
MDNDQKRLFMIVGVCLMCVKQAEKALQTSIDTVLDDESVKLAEQSEPERKQTLRYFIKRLKRRVKLPIRVKDRFYDFLRMRNQLVHELDFDFQTEKRREQAELFLLELTFTAMAITLLLTAVFQVWAQDEHGVDFFEVEADQTQQIIKAIEKQFGPLAREILAGRNKRALTRNRMRTSS